MILEAVLAYVHLLAILTLVVFLASEAALCRPEWMNPTIVDRLVTVDRIYGIAAGAVLVTGLLRVYLGMKGSAWYWGNWLLHLKLGLFVLAGLVSIVPTLRYIRWQKAVRAGGGLPAAAEVRATRKLVMVQAHIIPLIPLAAVFLARGFGH
ncbi:MAG: putative transrane protein [Ramlibacter sp.]|nr:putative transrane protein [Ramlibacter sp.]